MHVTEFNVKAKAKWISPSFTCISNMFNKILNVLIDEIPKKLPPCCDVEVVSRSTPPFRALYRVNQKECEEHKNHIHDLMEKNYIRSSKSPYETLVLFVHKRIAHCKCALISMC